MTPYYIEEYSKGYFGVYMCGETQPIQTGMTLDRAKAWVRERSPNDDPMIMSLEERARLMRTRTVPCPACDGTGHMDEDLAMEMAREERRPVCWMYGCQECDGRGTVEEEIEEVD